MKVSMFQCAECGAQYNQERRNRIYENARNKLVNEAVRFADARCRKDHTLNWNTVYFRKMDALARKAGLFD